jgi:hypothetical protein
LRLPELVHVKKKHFIALAAAVRRILARMAGSEPGTGGRTVGLDVVEDIILGEIAEYVSEQGGDREKWRASVIAKDRLQSMLESLAGGLHGSK